MDAVVGFSARATGLRDVSGAASTAPAITIQTQTRTLVTRIRYPI
jgi:hypothetical protein